MSDISVKPPSVQSDGRSPHKMHAVDHILPPPASSPYERRLGALSGDYASTPFSTSVREVPEKAHRWMF